jgi:BirA family biotin operon repressor/biotin-[acetyl-CoA-carboxylase] ligase
MTRNRQSDLLRLLLGSGQMISEAKIGAVLGYESDELAHDIAALESAGFIIRRQARQVRLIAEPSRLAPESILARLDTVAIGRDVVVLKETSSTNDRVHQAGIAGAREGLVIFAERQTAGRGKYGRKWESMAGAGLWFSILLRPESDQDQSPLIAQAAALATVEALEPLICVEVEFKWPNDLLIDGAKLAGFLVERPAHGGFQVLGLGINIRSAPVVPGYSATFADRYASTPLPRARLAADILTRFESWYQQRDLSRLKNALSGRIQQFRQSSRNLDDSD